MKGVIFLEDRWRKVLERIVIEVDRVRDGVGFVDFVNRFWFVGCFFIFLFSFWLFVIGRNNWWGVLWLFYEGENKWRFCMRFFKRSNGVGFFVFGFWVCT